MIVRIITLCILVLTGNLALTGCELFTTRTPEKSSGSSEQGWQFPFTPSIIIENLVSAVGRRSVADYMQAFETGELESSQMEFIPDPETVSNYPGVFESWSNKRERSHVQSLFSPVNLPYDSLAVLELSIDRETVIGDSADISAQYVLHLGHLRDSAPREMEGRLEFRLRRSEQYGWYVCRWIDYRLAGRPCWSDLKAQF